MKEVSGPSEFWECVGRNLMDATYPRSGQIAASIIRKDIYHNRNTGRTGAAWFPDVLYEQVKEAFIPCQNLSEPPRQPRSYRKRPKRPAPDLATDGRE